MNLPEDVRKDIECPVCLQLPRDIPIFQCDNGHIICKDCKPQLELCPQCRTFVGHTRSLIAERIVSKIQHNCKFSEDGCDKKVLFEGLQGHERRCEFRPVPCVISDCGELIKRTRYLSHMESHHSVWFATNPNDLLELMSQQSDKPVGVIRTMDHIFLVVTEFQSGFLVKYIFILGSQVDRDKYECSVKIGKFDWPLDDQPDQPALENRTIMEYAGYINVFDDPARIPCFTMHPAQLKHYIDDTKNNSDITYYLNILVVTKDTV